MPKETRIRRPASATRSVPETGTEHTAWPRHEESEPSYSEDKSEPIEKRDTVLVTALEQYSNGMLEANWKRGETREIPAWKLKRLEQDLPGNWVVQGHGNPRGGHG